LAGRVVSVSVKTQAELDAALAVNQATIYIDSPAEVWLELAKSDGAHVVAREVDRWGVPL
jgi:hypothetical protein